MFLYHLSYKPVYAMYWFTDNIYLILIDSLCLLYFLLLLCFDSFVQCVKLHIHSKLNCQNPESDSKHLKPLKIDSKKRFWLSEEYFTEMFPKIKDPQKGLALTYFHNVIGNTWVDKMKGNASV